jgi:hypothetical protein
MRYPTSLLRFAVRTPVVYLFSAEESKRSIACLQPTCSGASAANPFPQTGNLGGLKQHNCSTAEASAHFAAPEQRIKRNASSLSTQQTYGPTKAGINTPLQTQK